MPKTMNGYTSKLCLLTNNVIPINYASITQRDAFLSTIKNDLVLIDINNYLLFSLLLLPFF